MPRLMAAIAGSVLLVLPLAYARGDAPVKTEQTLHSPEQIKAFAESDHWQSLSLKGDKRPFTAAVGWAPAEDWVGKSDEWIWQSMPSTTIGRTVTVGDDPFRVPKLGCPVHGPEIYGVEAYYPWVVDCDKLPYKLKCPIGGETYPSNDFAAGDFTSGDYPDDGSGCLKDGTPYYFMRLYTHYAYNTLLQPAIKSFGRAYSVTGDKRYAHKAAVCLLKEAYEYPNADDRKDRTYISGYEHGSGMITDVVWSAGALVASATSYDEILPALDGDQELVDFARQQIPEITSIDDVKLYIEDHLFRPGIQAILDGRILPNVGWGEECMASLGLLLSDYGEARPNTVDCLEWLYYGGGRLTTIGNQFYKDGSSYESTSYNDARGGYIRAADLIARIRQAAPVELDAERYPDIMQSENVQRFTDTYKPATKALGGARTICVGDVGSTGFASRPGRCGAPRPSEYLDGFGLAVLRSGEGQELRDVTLFYGGLRGHAHYDPLMLGLFGLGRDLLPNIGYPQSWSFAHAWEWSLATHNTVVVDRVEHPCSTVIGDLTVWSPGGACQVVGAAKRPYRKHEPRGEDGPDVSDYRRLVALIDISPTDWYVVDVFRATGGQDHLQSWHSGSPVDEARIRGIDGEMVQQDGGTLAGADVEYGTHYDDDRWDPYAYLHSVSRGKMAGVTTSEVVYPTDDSARVVHHFIPIGDTELVTAKGGAPVAPDKGVLEWMFPHRSGADGLVSQFVTVLEAHAGEETDVLGIQRLPVSGDGAGGYEPIAIEITHADGRDIILLGGDEEATLTGDGFSLTGKFGLIRERDGVASEMKLVAGTSLSHGDNHLEMPAAPEPCRIVSVDRDARSVVLEGETPDPAELAGKRVIIDNHGERLVSYTVTEAERLDDGRTRLVLDSQGAIGNGIAVGFEDGIITNGPEVNMPFAGLCEIDGRLDYSDCFYRGGHLETGEPGVDLKVRGVIGFPYQAWGALHDAGTNHVHLAEKIDAARLETMIGDQTRWTIYEYGVGDEVSFDREIVWRA